MKTVSSVHEHNFIIETSEFKMTCLNMDSNTTSSQLFQAVLLILGQNASFTTLSFPHNRSIITSAIFQCQQRTLCHVIPSSPHPSSNRGLGEEGDFSPFTLLVRTPFPSTISIHIYMNLFITPLSVQASSARRRPLKKSSLSILSSRTFRVWLVSSSKRRAYQNQVRVALSSPSRVEFWQQSQLEHVLERLNSPLTLKKKGKRILQKLFLPSMLLDARTRAHAASSVSSVKWQRDFTKVQHQKHAICVWRSGLDVPRPEHEHV